MGKHPGKPKPFKTCVVCQRPFGWRKKWRRNWADVRYCSERCRRNATRALSDSPLKVAVIGAGIAGLIGARTLADHGCDVTVYEKSRGVGGRMSTRRVNDILSFDHGAQYFTARDQRFKRYVHSWVEDGLVQPWTGRLVVVEKGVVTADKTSNGYSAMSEQSN